jgi:hypothetical protein
MNRSKIVAVITGVISILLAVGYLILVQLLDFRGEMKPAPTSQAEQIIIAIAKSSGRLSIHLDPANVPSDITSI